MNFKTTLIIGFAALLGILVFVFLRDDGSGVITPLSKTWEKAVPYQEIPDGLNSLLSEDCGICHKSHYEEWKLSTHAQAWVDLQFQAEIKKESSPFFCINCHIPLQNQQEYLVDGYVDGKLNRPHRTKNKRWNRKLQWEGVNCASCHIRGNTIVGPTGVKNPVHKTVKDSKYLSETLCIGCHNITSRISPELVCSFQTGDEWRRGPYSATKNCISCHMRELNRANVEGFEKKKSHSHYFSGSGIPKFDSLETTILNGMAFYPSELKSKFSVNETIKYSIRLKNEHAGHRVPTGNPERFFLISMRIFDNKGELIDEKIERIGEKWEWYPIAKKLSDTNLNPLEERSYELNWKAVKQGEYKLVVEVTKHRMDEKTAEYNKLPKEYPLEISIFKKEYFIEVIN